MSNYLAQSRSYLAYSSAERLAFEQAVRRRHASLARAIGKADRECWLAISPRDRQDLLIAMMGGQPIARAAAILLKELERPPNWDGAGPSAPDERSQALGFGAATGGPSADLIRRILTHVPHRGTLRVLGRRADVSPTYLGQIIAQLESEGVLQVRRSGKNIREIMLGNGDAVERKLESLPVVETRVAYTDQVLQALKRGRKTIAQLCTMTGIDRRALTRTVGRLRETNRVVVRYANVHRIEYVELVRSPGALR